MTEPLIVVEGTLRLPSLRPLTDPLLRFGREWSSARMRPIRSNSEISLFAARLETAYTAAISLADRGAPYRPMSLWTVLPEQRLRQTMLRLMQGQEPDDTPTPVAAPVAEPIALTVQTPATPRANASPLMPTPLKTAIAVACAALVAWLIFGRNTQQTEEAAPVIANNTNTSDVATPASEPAESAAPTPVPVAIDTPAVMVPAPVDPAAPVAPVEPVAQVTPIEPVAPAIAGNAPAPVAAAAPTKPHTAARSVRHPRPSPAAAVSHASTDRQAAKKQPATRTANAYGDAKRATPARSTNYAPRAAVLRTSPATKPAGALDTRSLYDMLQHSPTLDNNFAAGVPGGQTHPVSAR